MTETSKFGVGRREGHNSSAFYSSKMMSRIARGGLWEENQEYLGGSQIICKSSEVMDELPDRSVGLAFTSPPYNVQKEYDKDLSLDEYLGLIERVGNEVYRTLVSGGRYVINVANLGRKPYVPLHAMFYEIHQRIGFLPIGEIIWVKAKGAGENCVWKSWMSAKAPSLRDVHEYLLVFTKDTFGRPDKGESTVSRNDFMESTLSVWEIAPESAKRIGHPAPFPIALAKRVINLYSYTNDVVLDPFMGSGTTCVAADWMNRRFVGYEIEPAYCEIAVDRINKQRVSIQEKPIIFG